MRMKRLCSMALGFLFLACTLPAGLAAQTSSPDVDQKIADLEKQLEAVRAELDALKKPAAPAPAPAPANAVVEAPAAAAAPAPNPMSGIISVLGGVNLTGLADVYYGYNANHPAAGTITEPFQITNSQFSLNLVELQLDKTPDKSAPLGFRVAVGFGQAMNAVHATPSTELSASQTFLKEGYLSYMAPIGKGLQIDAGKFVTPAGAEVIETNQNWNYSRSIMFYDAIPFYHFGLRAKYTFNDKWSVTGYAVNGWNNVVDFSSGKTGGISLAWNATKKLSITENYFGGPQQVGLNGSWRHLTDTVVAYNATPKLSLMANVDYGRQENVLGSHLPADYSGIAGYAKYAFSPKVAVAGRYEYYNDHDGFTSGKAQHLNEFTGTIERKIAGHLLSRVEFRHDASNQDFFQRGGPSLVKGQTTVDAGLVFVLEPSETK
jgi:Putative beta-barrel porin-2, OmpL-like. bbp2